jgi:integrase
MRGHVISRGPINSRGKHEGPPYTVVVELGEQPAQECTRCADPRGGHKLYWLLGEPFKTCPKCGAQLENVRKRRQWTKSGFKLKREADAALAKQLVDRREGTYQEPTNTTVTEFLMQRWLPTVKNSVKPTTYFGYKRDCEAYLVPSLGSLRLRYLDPGHVNRFYGDLAAADAGRRGQGLSPKSRRLIHITLRKALGDAVKWGLIPRNAAALADPPRVTQRPMSVWNEEQLRAFLDSVADDRLYTMWRTFAMTGVRRGEALGLQWRHIDFANATLNLDQSRVAVGYEVVVSETKTGRGRGVSIDGSTLAAIKSWRDRQADELLAVDIAQGPDTWVFTDRAGEPLHPDRVTKLFGIHQVALRAEIVARHTAVGARGDAPEFPRVRLHDLRHTHATILLRAGVHPKVVQERLGHATISTTLDIYSHVLPGMQESAAALAAARVDAG